jgi:hypothetical protein
MELAALVAEALLASAEGTEVLGGLGDDVVVDVEVDAAVLRCGVGLAQPSSMATVWSGVKRQYSPEPSFGSDIGKSYDQ